MNETALATISPLEEYATVTDSSLTLRSHTPIEAWQEIGHSLGRFGRSIKWLVGDWLIQGEQLYGERYAQGMDVTGYRYQTLMNLASVASKVAPESRRADLSHAHHAEVAKFKTPAEQAHWLERAVTDKLTVKELRERIRATNGTLAEVAPDVDWEAEARELRAFIQEIAESPIDADGYVERARAFLQDRP